MTSAGRTTWRISRGTSLNELGTRSQSPRWNASRLCGDRNQETCRRPGTLPSM